tara:strand:+ start:412 stop:672 length:261 start_codon:yes stop_codon:yes gene_type:complete
MKKLFSLLTLFLIFSCGGNPHESSKSIIQEGINNITKMDYDAYIELISPENREDIRERVLKMTEKDKKNFQTFLKTEKLLPKEDGV